MTTSKKVFEVYVYQTVVLQVLNGVARSVSYIDTPAAPTKAHITKALIT